MHLFLSLVFVLVLYWFPLFVVSGVYLCGCLLSVIYPVDISFDVVMLDFLAVFLIIELCFLLCEYNKLEVAFVTITRFSLELALFYLINFFTFDVCGFNILLNSLLVIFLILIHLFLYDVVLLSFLYPLLSNKVLDRTLPLERIDFSFCNSQRSSSTGRS